MQNSTDCLGRWCNIRSVLGIRFCLHSGAEKMVFHLGCKYCEKLAIAFGLINTFVDTSLYRKWRFASVGWVFDIVNNQFLVLYDYFRIREIPVPNSEY